MVDGGFPYYQYYYYDYHHKRMNQFKIKDMIVAMMIIMMTTTTNTTLFPWSEKFMCIQIQKKYHYQTAVHFKNMFLGTSQNVNDAKNFHSPTYQHFRQHRYYLHLYW